MPRPCEERIACCTERSSVESLTLYEEKGLLTRVAVLRRDRPWSADLAKEADVESDVDKVAQLRQIDSLLGGKLGRYVE